MHITLFHLQKKVNTNMEYELMHKDRPVALLDLSSDKRTISVHKATLIGDSAHMPVGTAFPGSCEIKRQNIKDWLRLRAIPMERDRLRSSRRGTDLPYPHELLLDSLGLSLSDQYWMRPAASNISWGDVNFFQNGFSEDLGYILWGKPDIPKDCKFFSPDAALNGNLTKKWIIKNDKRVLVKVGRPEYYQEAQNEVIASRVMESLGIDHVHYILDQDYGTICSLCETFVDSNTDFVPANFIVKLCDGKRRKTETYDFFIKCCEKRGIPGAKQAMDRLFVVDFILFNLDRHFLNFGALRDTETLEWKGMSPVFDTGCSLWLHKNTQEILPEEIGECHWSWGHFSKMLLYVSDFSWLDPARLKELPDLIAGTFIPTKEITPERIEKIRQSLIWRVQYLENGIQNRSVFRKSYVRHLLRNR
jgi:hypothetical protein